MAEAADEFVPEDGVFQDPKTLFAGVSTVQDTVSTVHSTIADIKKRDPRLACEMERPVDEDAALKKLGFYVNKSAS